MTTLGHSLVGATLGLAFLPRFSSTFRRLLFLTVVITVASLPDWPLPGWGHYRFAVSHSIFVNGLLMLGVGLTWHRIAGGEKGKFRLILMVAIAAWLSHFLLDTLYVNTSLSMFWPFSTSGVSLPVPWLVTMPHVPPPFDAEIIRIFLLEALTFGLPLVLVAAMRRRAS